MATARAHVTVRGEVQGVFYRAGCAAEARRRGVLGWVRNTPDGSVEAVFEGAAPDVQALIAWCRTGPELARVESVDVSREPPTGRETGFEARG